MNILKLCYGWNIPRNLLKNCGKGSRVPTLVVSLVGGVRQRFVQFKRRVADCQLILRRQLCSRLIVQVTGPVTDLVRRIPLHNERLAPGRQRTIQAASLRGEFRHGLLRRWNYLFSQVRKPNWRCNRNIHEIMLGDGGSRTSAAMCCKKFINSDVNVWLQLQQLRICFWSMNSEIMSRSHRTNNAIMSALW
jgi:hypothetical protein